MGDTPQSQAALSQRGRLSPAFKESPMGLDYLTLLDEGWPQEKALYMAWEAHPSKSLRKYVGLPLARKQLAEDVLGIDDSAIRHWRAKNVSHPSDPDAPAMLDRIARLNSVEDLLDSYWPGAVRAMGETASMPGKDGTGDRRLMAQIKGAIKQVAKVDVTSDGQQIAAPVIYIPDNGRLDDADDDSSADA